MTPERWHQVDDLLSAVLEKEIDQRASFLAKACAGDDELRRQVESLLRAHEKATHFLEHGPAESPLNAEIESMLGRRIGSYRLLREMGQGGMGTVYLAERADGEYEKRVAVKILKPGMDTVTILERFRRERQILASLQHPNIATLLEGGTAEDGLPYFVMEYIEGQRLLDYCDSRRLSVRDRLKLFRTICSAVQYAHENLVVHRDLKPGNVLVTADGIPKLVDFGIAKILQSEFGSQRVDATNTGIRLMTPEYASPEQIHGGQITAASDIYSLGILLYELLTGRRPSQHKKGNALPGSQPQRTKPSDAIDRRDGLKASQSSEQISTGRSSTLRELRRQLTGDLDDIVLKAIKLEPHRRYASVRDFSKDLRRYLAGVPILARKDSRLYRARKYIQRHWAAILKAILR